MAHGSSHSSKDSHEHVGHVVSPKVFLNVLIFLLVMTVLTVCVAERVSGFHLGAWGIVVAMGVASVKALAVALFFMHLKFEDGATWMYAAIPLILMAILLGGLFIDNPFRH